MALDHIAPSTSGSAEPGGSSSAREVVSKVVSTSNTTAADLPPRHDVTGSVDDVTKLMIACYSEDDVDVHEQLAPPDDTEDLAEYRRCTVRETVLLSDISGIGLYRCQVGIVRQIEKRIPQQNWLQFSC